METLTELFSEIESLEALQYEIDNGTHLASVVERIITARDNHKEYLAFNSSVEEIDKLTNDKNLLINQVIELELTLGKSENRNISLESQLMRMRHGYRELQESYEQLAKYTSQLLARASTDSEFIYFFHTEKMTNQGDGND